MAPPFVQLISPCFYFTWKVTTVLRQLHDHPSITKAAGRLFLSIAISNQLNAAPYLRHKPWQLLRELEKRPCQPYSTRNFTCALISLPDQWPWSLVWERLYVRMRTTLENGILRNGQQLGRAENSFIDQGEFVAMKISISFVIKWQWVLEPFLRYCCWTLWS